MATKKSETVKKKVAKKVVKKAPAADDSPPAVPVHLEIEMLETELLDAHPENRDVKNPECESLAESIRARGVREPVTVRRHPLSPGRYEIVSGHRRVVASRMAGLVAIPAMVREMDDLEALELVLVSNLERMELDPAEEARGVAALARAGLTPDVLAERLHRSREWVQLRLALGDLPAPMREAVAEKRVSLGAVAQVLRCEDGDRERAIQLVLRPTMQNMPLNADQSREVLEREILGPQKRRADWEKGMAKRLAAWKERLAKVAKDAGLPVSLVALGYDDKLPGGNLSYAMEALDEDDLLSGAPEGALLAHLAIRHGQPVFVVPAAKVRWLQPEVSEWGIGDEPESIILVDEYALREAEKSLSDAEDPVMPAWLGSSNKSSPRQTWEEENEAKRAIADELSQELVGFVDFALGNMDPSRSKLLWRQAYLGYLAGHVDMDLAASVAGTVVPGCGDDVEGEEKQFALDLEAFGKEKGYPDGWAFLAGGIGSAMHVYAYNMKLKDGVAIVGKDSLARLRAALECYPEVDSLPDVLPRLHELLEASAAADADGSTDDHDADGEE